MRKEKPHLTIATAALLCVILPLSCSRSPSSGEPPPPAPSITAADLISGAEGVLRGTNLHLLPTTLSVDGRAVVPSLRTGTEIRFPMPPARACEIDGRAVAIVAGALSYTGQLTVPSVVRMEPGESRVFTRQELSAACIQLPASRQDWVFTALNSALEVSAEPELLFTLRTWVDADSPSTADLSEIAPRPEHSTPQVPLVRFDVTPGSDFYSAEPITFDPRYGTAVVGDTVRWVDFRSPLWYNDGGICRAPAAGVPTFGAVVAAVSASGRTVIAYDARTAYREQWSRAEIQARLTRLAEIVERWTLAAVREVFGGDFLPVRGAGERWWHIFRVGVTQPGIDQAGLPRSMCPHYSEVATTLAPDIPPVSDAQIEVLAGYLVHEYAHHAEDVIAVRRWGNVFARGAPRWPGVSEAWAQTVQETASRIASNQPTAARYEALSVGSGVPYADFYETGYGERPDLSPWSGGRGPYDHGTRLLMFLREQWGDAEIGASRERFYAAVLGLQRYDFASMAGLVGMDPLTALDRWSLAEATDDLVEPAVASSRGLPQLATWVPQDRAPSRRAPTTHNAAFPFSVARGSYTALYFSGATEGRTGFSLTFSGFGSAPFVARLTRLR